MVVRGAINTFKISWVFSIPPKSQLMWQNPKVDALRNHLKYIETLLRNFVLPRGPCALRVQSQASLRSNCRASRIIFALAIADRLIDFNDLLQSSIVWP